MARHVSVSTCRLESFEGLSQAIKGSHVEVVQLGRGKFRGSLSHVDRRLFAQHRLVFGRGWDERVSVMTISLSECC